MAEPSLLNLPVSNVSCNLQKNWLIQRFWFENDGVFLPEEVEDIKKIKLWDVIVNATNVSPNEIQKEVFFWHEGDPCPQPRQLNASDLQPCALPKEKDSFQVIIILCVSMRFASPS